MPPNQSGSMDSQSQRRVITSVVSGLMPNGGIADIVSCECITNIFRRELQDLVALDG